MAILHKKRKNIEKIEIDLNGPHGNAFYLLGLAKDLSKLLGLDFDKIRKEMTLSNYDNLIKVFDKHFGNYVDLIYYKEED